MKTTFYKIIILNLLLFLFPIVTCFAQGGKEIYFDTPSISGDVITVIGIEESNFSDLLFSASHENGSLMQWYDTSLTLLNSMKIQLASGAQFHINAMERINDSTAIVVGSYETAPTSFYFDIFVGAINISSQSVLWAKRYNIMGSWFNYGYGVKIRNASSIWVLGETGPGDGTSKAVVLDVKPSNGNLNWIKAYESSFPTLALNKWLRCKELSNGNILLEGQNVDTNFVFPSPVPTPDIRMVVAIADTAGNIIYHAFLNAPQPPNTPGFADYLYSTIELQGGGILINGYSNWLDAIWLIKLNSSLNTVLFSNEYTTPNLYEYSRAVHMVGSNIEMVGDDQNGGIVLSIDTSGNLLSSKRLANIRNSTTTYAWWKNGARYILGAYDNGSYDNYYLNKSSLSGFDLCNFSNDVCTVTPVSYILESGLTTSIPSITSNNATVSITPFTGSHYQLCPTATQVENLEHKPISFDIYPNPANSNINIEPYAQTPFDLKIINMFGQLIFAKQSNENKYSVNISTFEPGLYLFQIESQGKVYPYKVVISE